MSSWEKFKLEDLRAILVFLIDFILYTGYPYLASSSRKVNKVSDGFYSTIKLFLTIGRGDKVGSIASYSVRSLAADLQFCLFLMLKELGKMYSPGPGV